MGIVNWPKRWGVALFVAAAAFAAGTVSLAAPARSGSPVAVKTAYGTEFLAYEAGPAEAQFGVIVLPDRFGLDSFTLGFAERFMKLGYRVLVVDLFDGRTERDPVAAERMNRAIDPAWNDANLRAAIKHLRGEGRSIAVVGLGYGGAVAMRASLIAPNQVAGVVNYYGAVPVDVATVKNIAVPTMVVHARQDRAIPEKRVGAFEEIMRQYKHAVAVVTIDAAAGFVHPDFPSYNDGAAQNAFNRVQEFLGEVLR